MTSRECSRALKTTNFHSFKAKYKEMRGDARLLHNPIFLILSVYLNPKNLFCFALVVLLCPPQCTFCMHCSYFKFISAKMRKHCSEQTAVRYTP